MLSGKNIIIGITGSIAAYKAALLIRLLVKEGANVKVIMTDGAQQFITPLTISTLAKSDVITTYVANDVTGKWNNHVELGLWADYMIVAPATANTLAKMANGICDHVLLATYLSARCPVAIAPAMDLDMYQHPTTKSNLKTLINHHVQIIPAGVGELASGLSGEGRMAEPEEIVEFLQKRLSKSKKGKAVISAGPTFEAIDPVRFIGNHSSGKMGFALAHEAASRGWEVTLVTGPTSQEIENSSINRIDVVSAAEMLRALSNEVDDATLLIMSAAVADYKPKFVADQKIKKAASEATIELGPTTDILATLGAQKKEHQCFVGFALETENELAHAQGKLERKNLDFIVLNSLNNKGAGFGHDTNKITIIGKDTKPVEFELKSKEAVAYDIFNHIDENHNS